MSLYFEGWFESVLIKLPFRCTIKITNSMIQLNSVQLMLIHWNKCSIVLKDSVRVVPKLQIGEFFPKKNV